MWCVLIKEMEGRRGGGRVEDRCGERGGKQEVKAGRMVERTLREDGRVWVDTGEWGEAD